MRIRAVKYFVCRQPKPAAATTELVCTNECAYQRVRHSILQPCCKKPLVWVAITMQLTARELLRLQQVAITTGTTDDGHMRVEVITRGRMSTYSKFELICAENNYSSRDDSPDLLIPGS
jgi:hypothetical protein